MWFIFYHLPLRDFWLQAVALPILTSILLFCWFNYLSSAVLSLFHLSHCVYFSFLLFLSTHSLKCDALIVNLLKAYRKHGWFIWFSFSTCLWTPTICSSSLTCILFHHFSQLKSEVTFLFSFIDASSIYQSCPYSLLPFLYFHTSVMWI